MQSIFKAWKAPRSELEHKKPPFKKPKEKDTYYGIKKSTTSKSSGRAFQFKEKRSDTRRNVKILRHNKGEKILYTQDFHPMDKSYLSRNCIFLNDSGMPAFLAWRMASSYSGTGEVSHDLLHGFLQYLYPFIFPDGFACFLR